MGAKLAVDDARYSDEMAAVSPEGRLHTMNTPVFLLAGTADDVVPSAETLWLARELPQHALQAMLVSPEISHVSLTGAKPGIMDEWQLAHFFALVMRASEKKEGNK